jgi:hypothetical protein
MKTMTCKHLGGPCDLEFHGETADEIIKADDSHLKDLVAKGDVAHGDALKLMEDRWKNPANGMDWYEQVQVDFASTPDDT